jgi:hypothetical protein
VDAGPDVLGFASSDFSVTPPTMPSTHLGPRKDLLPVKREGLAIVTGVNRSGTSFVANLIGELGGDLGPPELLLGSDHRNERGYFENKEILSANIRLLLGTHVDPNWWIQAIEQGSVPIWSRLLKQAAKLRYFQTSARARAVRAVTMESTLRALASKYCNTTVNDPRFCSTLGLWARHVPISRVLFVYRHPTEVVRSLRHGYWLPEWAGYRYWCQQVREFLAQVEGLPLVIVNYASFYSPETRLAEARRVCSFIGCYRGDEGLDAALSRVLDSGLRHHDVSDEVRLNPEVQALYETLRRYHSIYSVPRAFTPQVG